MMLPFLPARPLPVNDWMWGAAAGITGGIGVALLYHALAIGSMAIVAPITAVCAVTVPVGAAIALGERPGTGATAESRLRSWRSCRSAGRAHQPHRYDATNNFTSPARRAVRRHRRRLGRSHRVVLPDACPEREANAGMWPLVAARAALFATFVDALLSSRDDRRASTRRGSHRNDRRGSRHARRPAVSGRDAIRPAEPRGRRWRPCTR